MFLAFPYMQMNEAGKPENQTDRLGGARVNNIAGSACFPFRFVNNGKYDVGIWCVAFQA